MRSVPKLRILFATATTIIGAALVITACSSLEDATANPSTSADGGFGSDGTTSDAGTTPVGVGAPFQANGLVLVHAARLPGFRLCFDADQTLRPLPSKELMPDSNVAGVEVGSAVRIDPIGPAIGKVYLYEEPSIRQLYETVEEGPECSLLLGSPNQKVYEVGAIDKDLSSGVHLLVVQGCRKAADDPGATKALCGDTWTAGTGNLRLETISLSAYQRPMPGLLPVQVAQLSSALASHAKNRELSITFGPLGGGGGLGDGGADGGGGTTTSLFSNLPFGVVIPQQPTTLNYNPEDTAAYATSGFRISLSAGADGGGGVKEVLLSQSLADVGRLSSSRDVPPQWFAAASSYVLLVLGTAVADVGGPDAGDAAANVNQDQERERLHLLAVPVAPPAEPEPVDAGASEDAANDGAS